VTADPVVRPARADDNVLGVIRAAFGPEEGEQVAAIWAEVEETGLALGSLVAEVDGRVVGHVGLSRAWLDARRELVDVWLLSPLAVLPGDQGEGVGTRLLAAAVDAAATGGAPLLFLEGDPGFYGARGFARASAHGFAPASDRIPDPAFQVVVLRGAEDWMTGRVVYRDVWWRHDAAGLRDPVLARVEAQLAESRAEEE
jgi:putative acetyltransferase